MLSPNCLSPSNISFNLSLSPSPLPLFTQLQALRKSSASRKLNNTHHFIRCSSCPNQSSLHTCPSSEDSSSFLDRSDSESSLYGQSQTLSPSQLAIWLRSCRSLRDVKRVHSVVLKRLRDANIYLHNNLICVCLKFVELSYARNVFDEMPQRNVVTWTAIINGFLRFGLEEEALTLFEECIRSGIRPNERLFVCALNLCSERNDLELGRQVHAGLAKSVGKSNTIADTAVAKLYARCGDLAGAFRAFERTSPKDVVSWTAMVSALSRQGRGTEALSLFSRMSDDGFAANEFTLCAVLKACGDEKALRLGRQLHGAVLKKVYDSDDVFVGTSLVDMYANCGEVADSRKVFDKMRKRNTAAWTAIVAGYARKGLGDEALGMFRAMMTWRERVPVNGLTVVSAVRACGVVGPAARLAGRELHARVVKDPGPGGTGLHLGSTLVWFYCRCEDHGAAARVLGAMPSRDVVSWTAMISGLAGLAGMEGEALGVLRAMGEEDGVEPNAWTVSSALKACARLERAGLRHGRAVHSAVSKAGPAAAENVFVGSALIHMYARWGRVGDASRVFDGMAEKNSVAWRSMVVGFARNGLGREAMGLLYRMRAEGFEVDDYVRTSVLNACGGGESRSECELMSSL